MVSGLLGEAVGVFSKGVWVWLWSSISKFERPDDGLVNGVDGKGLVRDDVCTLVVVVSGFGSVDVPRLAKRPKLSLSS